MPSRSVLKTRFYFFLTKGVVQVVQLLFEHSNTFISLIPTNSFLTWKCPLTVLWITTTIYSFIFFRKVLWEYLSPRLNQNIQSLQVHTKDEYFQNKRLVTAAIIASLVGYHEMTFLRDDVIKDLLECLTLNGDPYRRRCSGLNAILHHFPQKEHLR